MVQTVGPAEIGRSFENLARAPVIARAIRPAASFDIRLVRRI